MKDNIHLIIFFKSWRFRVKTLTREAKRGDRIIYLTNKEYKLLELLMVNKNKIVTRGEINEVIWQGESDKNIEGVYIAFLKKNRKRFSNTDY